MIDILIIGAGAAGLAAAGELLAAGLKVTLLEARNRIGGRILTTVDSRLAVPAELGAEFVHGRPAETWDLLGKAGVALYEVLGGDWYSEQGMLRKTGEREPEHVFEALRRNTNPDRSFRQAAEQLGQPSAWATAYVEGFHAAFAEKISVQSILEEEDAAASIEGDRSFRVMGGYDRVPAALLPAEVDLRLNSPVKELRWSRGHAEIEANGETFEAPKVIVTVPLPLLQENTLRITPEPVALLAAARSLEMGQVMRVTMGFRERFWESRADFSFLHSLDQAVPTWWSTLPVYAPVLVGWAAGPKFRPDLNIRDAVQSLAAMLGMEDEAVEKQVITTCFHNWYADPYARGAYSYAPVGTIGARKQLTEPVEETLFFAGEHTETEGHSGTVHGAIRTGRRAARQVLRSVR